MKMKALHSFGKNTIKIKLSIFTVDPYMDIFGIHTGFLMFQLPFLLFIAGWLILSVTSLYFLYNSQTTQINTLLWVLCILLVPWLGAIAFLVIRLDRKIQE